MIKCKKKGKSLLLEDDSMVSEDRSYSVNPSRNILAALDERISDLERGKRNRRRPRYLAPQSFCKSQRSHSVPTKTVSFNPCIPHREEHEDSDEKGTPNWKNNCAWCEMKGRRSSLPGREKPAMTTRSKSTDNDESCVSSNRRYDSAESCAHLSSSPRPAKFYRDFSDSATDCRRYWRSDPTESFHSERYDVSSVLPYGMNRYRQMYPSFFSNRILGRHEMTPSYITRSKSDDILRVQEQSVMSDGMWKNDSNINFLLAKYGDYNAPKMFSFPTHFFPYKSSFLRTDSSLGNISHNKTPFTRTLSFTAQTKTNPASRSLFKCSSLPPRCVAMINNYLNTSDAVKYSTDKSFNCSYDYITYQPFVTSSFINDTLFRNSAKIFRTPNPLVSAKSEYDNYMQSWLGRTSWALRSRMPLTFLGRSASLNSLGAQKNFSDDKKVNNRLSTFSSSDASNNRNDASKFKLENCYSFHIKESPLLSSPTNYVYKDAASFKSYTPYAIKKTESKQDSNSNWNDHGSPKWDMPMSQNYFNREMIRGPAFKNTNTFSYNFLMPSFHSLPVQGTKRSTTKSSFQKILDFENSYLSSVNKLGRTELFHRYDKCRSLDEVEPERKIWERGELDNRFRSNFKSDFMKAEQLSRSNQGGQVDNLSVKKDQN